ncbi:MAG: efflux RND transporter periplasmic adaptor subunit [Allorhizobium sp.]
MNVLPLTRVIALALALAATTPLAAAETIRIEPVTIPEWKAVYGRVEARDEVPARARIGGTLVELTVTEGDIVKAGDVIATVKDDKNDFQIVASEAELAGLLASMENAQSELARGEELIKRGVTTAQRLDALRTQVDVLKNQIASAQAQRSVVVQQGKEGSILAPTAGMILSVPVTRDAVIMAGETVATIGGGGFFLRLAIPERHANLLKEGTTIEIETGNGSNSAGRLAKIYPQIDNGRVIADVEVADLATAFVNKRLLVRVPVGSRQALMVPQAALSTRFGVDFLSVTSGKASVERAVVTARPVIVNGVSMTEILTGLNAGDEVLLP